MSTTGRSADEGDITQLGSRHDTVAHDSARAVPPAVLARGTAVGRYVVLDLVGAGAMGTVYAAYDPKLDRKIALKLVRPHPDEDREPAQQRLLREAQALARLSHPNVVTVHDAGAHDDEVFVAMEFVEGCTLGAWLAEAERSWQAIVDVFGDAARGLAAAHAAGLVHRDFKPDNVMVARSGRAHVMDFGLARAQGTAPIEAEKVERDKAAPGESPVGSISATRTGGAIGTPKYMAPEIHRGDPVDARSDQFSFCVALYEAVYRCRPFEAATVPELAIAVVQGRLREPPSSGAPQSLWALVRRGLSVDPSQRWPDMSALASALGRLAHPPARSRWGLVAAIGTTATAALVVLAMRAPKAACGDSETHLVGVWDAARRDAVGAAILGTGVSFAEGERARVVAALDAHTDAWVASHREACLAHHRGEQSGHALDVRMACLDDRLARVEATVDVLAHADATVVEHATAMTGELGSIARCDDLEALLAELPPPEDEAVAARVATVRRELAESRTRQAAGWFDDALARATKALDDATATEHAPVVVEARIALGIAHERAGSLDLAERELVDAFMAATAIGHDEAAATAAIESLEAIGRDPSRAIEVASWERLAGAAVTRAGAEIDARARLAMATAAAEARLGNYEASQRAAEEALALRREAGDEVGAASALLQVALLDNRLGHFDRARQRSEEALEVQRAALGDDHPAIATALMSLAGSLSDLGRAADAKIYAERAVAIREKAFGRDSIGVAEALRRLAGILERNGELADGRATAERSLAIYETAYGKDDPRVAPAISMVASLAYASADIDAARAAMERVLAIRERTLAPDHPDLALACLNLGAVLHVQGDRTGALRHYERALAIREAKFGPDHPDVAMTLGNIALVLTDEGKFADALPLRERELAIREKVNGPEHLETGIALGGLGNIELELAERSRPELRDQAIAHLERSLELLDRVPHEKLQAAVTSFLLGRALWDRPGQRARARAYVERARDVMTGVDFAADRLADIERFLAAHGEASRAAAPR